VDPKTLAYLRVADENRAIALDLLTPAPRRPPRYFEWVAVVAFYASVHNVNALLWEKQRFEPARHQQRSQAVRSNRLLVPCRVSYSQLNNSAWQARYKPSFSVSETDVRRLVDLNLRDVEATVMRALGMQVPAWTLPARRAPG